MKILETSKLKRNELIFIISVIGFVLTLLIDFLTGIFSDKGLAHSGLALSIGGITALFLCGFLLSVICLILESIGVKKDS